MFPHYNIHKYACGFPDGTTHNQTDHIWIDRQKHLCALNIWSSSAADCDTNHYLVVAKIRKRLAVNKQGAIQSQ
jgi:hypothetical protein